LEFSVTFSGATGSDAGTGCCAAARLLPLRAGAFDVVGLAAAGFADDELLVDFAEDAVARLAGFDDDLLDVVPDVLGDALADVEELALDERAAGLADALSAALAGLFAVLFVALFVALLAVLARDVLLVAVLPAGSALADALLRSAVELAAVRPLSARSSCLASESTRLVSLSTSACRAVVLSWSWIDLMPLCTVFWLWATVRSTVFTTSGGSRFCRSLRTASATTRPCSNRLLSPALDDDDARFLGLPIVCTPCME
jgi:hypothetical protein